MHLWIAKHFIKACQLQWHAKLCSQGRPLVACSNKRVEAPNTAYERAFYSIAKTSAPLIQECTSKLLGKHIHHAFVAWWWQVDCWSSGGQWWPSHNTNTTTATGTVVISVFHTIRMKLSTTTKPENINFSQKKNVQEHSKQPATILSRIRAWRP